MTHEDSPTKTDVLLREIVVRKRLGDQHGERHVGRRTFAQRKNHGRVGRSSRATGRHTPVKSYSKPEERNRVTGSASGIGSRLKIQRATANPNAA
jgi:hypothetical protein